MIKCFTCFKCCESTDHIAKDCTAVVKCRECDSDRHPTALHPVSEPRQQPKPSSSTTTTSAEKSREHMSKTSQDESINIRCTQVCSTQVRQRSCHQICLAKVFPTGHPEKAAKTYVILDGESNQFLVSPEFFKLFERDSVHPQHMCWGPAHGGEVRSWLPNRIAPWRSSVLFATTVGMQCSTK